jgi:hypothetical protein
LDRRLYGTQSQSEHGGEGKNSQPLPRLEPPIIQPVAQRYTTELSGLLSDHGKKYLRNYEGVSKRFRTVSVKKYMLTTMNIH